MLMAVKRSYNAMTIKLLLDTEYYGWPNMLRERGTRELRFLYGAFVKHFTKWGVSVQITKYA